MEKLLVCEALDERDFLRKKIISSIKSAKFIASKRKKDQKVGGVVSTDEFNKEAQSTYQSIVDLIDRYKRLDTAIVQANAQTEIKTRSGQTMTRAAAIALRKTLFESPDTDFEGLLLSTMSAQYNSAVSSVAMLDKKADTELENYKNNLTGRDSKTALSDEQIDMCEKLTADLHGELIDPLSLEAKIKERDEAYSSLKKELDSAIKTSNATTYVEF